MTLRSLLMAGVLTMAAGCASDSLDGPLDYQLTAGITSGKSVLHVDSNGAFTRTPFGGTPSAGTLDSAALASLRDKLDAVDFSSLEAQYRCCADARVQTLAVQINGTTHTVEADELAEVPPQLDALLDTLRDLAVPATE